ncbi:hypothetical protein FGADI_7952 [Fusarium gaditjirri]|uniref:Uncharacterized protein n=1 Tax=Fusarium gaditjirri TaxID=282569 RepID=A0A8H4T3X6_9HYPO|nr:hypothetical protein FGADI_7952 [Fusarium gaditjirri]
MANDSLSLEGKVAIVTGSGRENGIGAAIAATLAQHGAAVTIHHVSNSVTERAHAVAKGIRADGGKAAVVQTSIETPEGAQYLVDETLRAFNTDHIDILINNAGVPLFSETLAVNPKQVTQALDVNIKGPIFVAQAVVPHIAPGGRIVNISSIASKLGDAYIPIYGASKAALDSLTWSWAKEWGRSKGITVNAVAPGPVLTDAIPAAIAGEFQRPFIEMTRAADRAGTSKDIADAVLLLVSEKARWITGHPGITTSETSSGAFGYRRSLNRVPSLCPYQKPNGYPLSARTSIAVDQEAPVCKLMRELCFALAFADDSAMHLVLARLEIDPERTGGQVSQESASSLTHYNSSIEILRNQLGGAQLMAHEAIIGVVVNLACYDMFTDNMARWKTHMSGLQKMIEYRGSVSTINIYRIDLTGSMILDQTPHLTLYQADLSAVQCIHSNLEDDAMDIVQRSHRDTKVLLELLVKLSNLAAGKSELELSEDSALLEELQAATSTSTPWYLVF